MTRQQLVEQILKKKTYLCVGLDSDITKIPKHLLSEPDPVFSFNKAIIDVTRELCVAYKINGKKASEIPADISRYDKIECVYEKMPGWTKSTEGITEFDKLPKKAQEYLRFVEKESGAKIGMVSTGADREQTIFIDDFAKELKKIKKHSAKA